MKRDIKHLRDDIGEEFNTTTCSADGTMKKKLTNLCGCITQNNNKCMTIEEDPDSTWRDRGKSEVLQEKNTKLEEQAEELKEK